MKINREKLIHCLEALEYSTKSARPITSGLLSQCAIFNKDVVYTNNGSLKVECKLDTDIKAAIKFDKFMSFVNSINSEEMDIEIIRDKVKIKADDISATFLIVDERDKSTVDLICNVEIICGVDFITALKECSLMVKNKFVGTSSSICGVIVDVDNKYCYSSDTFRILRYKVHSTITDKKINFSVPIKFIDILWKYRSDIEGIYTNDDRSIIQLKTKSGMTFTSVLINKNIQDLSKYFNNDGPSFIIECPNLNDIISRHSSINNASNAENTSGLGKIKGTIFKIDKGKLYLKTIFSNECTIDEYISIKNTGEEFCFALDTSYLDLNLVKNGIQVYTNNLIIRTFDEYKECLILISKVN